jgi:hypothetical protein
VGGQSSRRRAPSTWLMKAPQAWPRPDNSLLIAFDDDHLNAANHLLRSGYSERGFRLVSSG